jgi:hypothetical protein
MKKTYKATKASLEETPRDVTRNTSTQSTSTTMQNPMQPHRLERSNTAESFQSNDSGSVNNTSDGQVPWDKRDSKSILKLARVIERHDQHEIAIAQGLNPKAKDIEVLSLTESFSSTESRERKHEQQQQSQQINNTDGPRSWRAPTPSSSKESLLASEGLSLTDKKHNQSSSMALFRCAQLAVDRKKQESIPKLQSIQEERKRRQGLLTTRDFTEKDVQSESENRQNEFSTQKEKKQSTVQFSDIVELITPSQDTGFANATASHYMSEGGRTSDYKEPGSANDRCTISCQTDESSLIKTRRRVRHVQVQTRTLLQRTVGTQYCADIASMSESLSKPQSSDLDIENDAQSGMESVEEHAATLSNCSSLSTTGKSLSLLYNESYSVIALGDSHEHRKSYEELQLELETCRQLLLEEMGQNEQLRHTLREQRHKFDQISAAAYTKLKRLLIEKNQLAVEVTRLNAQLEGKALDEHWREADR